MHAACMHGHMSARRRPTRRWPEGCPHDTATVVETLLPRPRTAWPLPPGLPPWAPAGRPAGG
jgi:hypothetical protein